MKGEDRITRITKSNQETVIFKKDNKNFNKLKKKTGPLLQLIK